MDRRHFVKIGLAVSWSLLAPFSLPIKGLARAQALSKEELDLLMTAQVTGVDNFAQGNDAWVEIAPQVFANNIRELKKEIGPRVKLCIVMKSDAYAHGVENLISEALKAEPAYIGMVSNRGMRKAIKFMDESGTRATILRIAPATFSEAAEAVLHNWPVEELIGSLPQAESLSRIAGWVGKKRGKELVIPVHLNIDTGMGRMGFLRVEDIKKAMALPGLKVRGVMTHYANAYDPDLKRAEELTRGQLEKFDAVLAQLDLDDDVIIHTANSGATLCFPWSRRDMVRTGGVLYGDVPKEMNSEGRYQRAMPAFKSAVAWIVDKVPPNTPVGYESVYHTPKHRESTLATAKAGYNNGLPSWAYKSGTHVLIRGQRFPVVGKTSMNLVVVDVTGQDPSDRITRGDEVVFFGKQGKQEITIEELERTTGVPACELMLMIGNVTPRVLTD